MKGTSRKMKVKFYTGSYAQPEESSIYLYEMDTENGTKLMLATN